MIVLFFVQILLWYRNQYLIKPIKNQLFKYN